jgi:EAL and modified HD-GYP domain-containing signal transduction protein
MLAGLDRMKTWANVLSLGQLSDKPAVLREQAVLRGFLAQNLARLGEQAEEHTAFTLGLFSVLDAFMDVTMEEVCERLKLPPALSEALLHHNGSYGEILKLVVSNEMADWPDANWQALSAMGITPHTTVSAYQQALIDTRELMRQS